MKGGRAPAAPASMNESLGNGQKKTYLGVDSILYPKVKEARTVDALGRPIRRKTMFMHNVQADLPGLRGYGASGLRVQQIMSKQRAENFQKGIQTFIHSVTVTDDQEDEG